MIELKVLVLPPSSASSCLPEPFCTLMTDPNSPIKDFYPEGELKMDNGFYPLPILGFVDETRLVEALKPLESSLTEEQKERNGQRDPSIFCHCRHPFAKFLQSVESADVDVTSELGGILSRSTNSEQLPEEVQVSIFHPHQSFPIAFGVLPAAVIPPSNLRLDQLKLADVSKWQQKIRSLVCFECGKVKSSLSAPKFSLV